MHDLQPGSEQSESDVEISDLSGAERYRLLRAPAFVRTLVVQPRLRMRFWRMATGGLALVLLLVVLSGSFSDIGQTFQNLFAQPLPTTAVEPIISASPGITLHGRMKTAITIAVNSKPQIVPFTAALGSVPQSCLHTTSTQLFDAPAFPAGLGDSPMWVTGFSSSADQRSVLDHLRRAQPPQVGWYQQVQLVSSTNFTGSITLQGGIEGSILPLWFGTYPPGIAPRNFGLIQTITIYPQNATLSNHTTNDQSWGILLVNIYIAEAGCYYLKATWDSGTWTAYFAAGK